MFLSVNLFKLQLAQLNIGLSRHVESSVGKNIDHPITSEFLSSKSGVSQATGMIRELLAIYVIVLV